MYYSEQLNLRVSDADAEAYLHSLGYSHHVVIDQGRVVAPGYYQPERGNAVAADGVAHQCR